MISSTIQIPLLSLSLVFLIGALRGFFTPQEFTLYSNILYLLVQKEFLVTICAISFTVFIYKRLWKNKKRDYFTAISTSFASVALLLASYLISGIMLFYGLTHPLIENGSINFEAVKIISIVFLYNIFARDLALHFGEKDGIIGFLCNKIFDWIK